MLHESEEEILTVEDRMRLSLNKFKKLFAYLIMIVCFIFFISGMALYEIFTILPFLEGLEFELPMVDEDSLSFHIETIQLDIIVIIGVVVIAIVWMAGKGRKIYTELSALQTEKIRQAYYLVFETSSPHGENSIEKLFNLLRQVFPEVKESKRIAEKKQKEYKYVDWKFKDYHYDLKINVENGPLLVKYLEKQTFEELENIVKKTGKLFNKTHVFRLICIGKDFESVFQDYGFVDRMNSLSRLFKLDLIEESKRGFSVVWMD